MLYLKPLHHPSPKVLAVLFKGRVCDHVTGCPKAEYLEFIKVASLTLEVGKLSLLVYSLKGHLISTNFF